MPATIAAGPRIGGRMEAAGVTHPSFSGNLDMSDLVAIAFDKPEEADRVLTELARLKKEYLIDLEDAVVVIRQPDGVVNLKQSINLLGIGAATGGLRGRHVGHAGRIALSQSA